MKKILFSTLILSASIATAATPIDGWYVSGFGGYAYIPGHLDKWHNGLLRTDDRYKKSFDAGASIGFKSSPLRYEGEFTYIYGRLQQFRVSNFSQTGIKGSAKTALGMANIFYDFPAIVQTIEPFLGFGIGYAYLSGLYSASGPTFLTRYSPSGSAFAYQGAIGVTYNFAEAWSLNAGYRYVTTNHMDEFGKSYQANLINLGLVYRFDEMVYK
jgi:opacity protein-like surface antigen